MKPNNSLNRHWLDGVRSILEYAEYQRGGDPETVASQLLLLYNDAPPRRLLWWAPR